MLPSQIKSNLNNVFNNLLESVSNENLRELIATKTFFAGGSIRDLARNKHPKDYDLYFIDNESRDQFLSMASLDSSLVKTQINNYNHLETSCQFITLITGTPDDVVDQFDFSVNQGYYMPSTDDFSSGDLGNKLDVCPRVLSPLNALVRVIKMEEKGFEFDETTLIELGIAITQMSPISNREEIVEALKGLSAPNIEKALKLCDEKSF